MQYPSDQDISGRTFGAEEIGNVIQALASGTLIGGKGTFVRRLEQRFRELLDVQQVWACSSGSAALHTAIAALDLEPGSEVIVSPITDMGALTPILFQGCIPVFADVDDVTGNLTASAVAQRITSRTRAIVVTHLFGQCADLLRISELASAKQLFLIEDCAQAYLASHHGKPAGSWGQLAIFSLQQGKHASCGEGGLLVVNDPQLARRAFLFINKAWGYGDAEPDHTFSALNYRMNELSAAVALAQVDRLQACVSTRRVAAAVLSDALRTTEYTLSFLPQTLDRHAFWRFAFHVPGSAGENLNRVSGQLARAGVPHQAGYIRKPAFECKIFKEQATLGRSRWPFSLCPDWAQRHLLVDFPGTTQFLSTVIVLSWNERYSSEHAIAIAEALDVVSRDPACSSRDDAESWTLEEERHMAHFQA